MEQLQKYQDGYYISKEGTKRLVLDVMQPSPINNTQIVETW